MEQVKTVAANMQIADPALSTKEAIDRSNWILESGDYETFQEWLCYEPSPEVAPPPEPTPAPVPKRERANGSGLDFGR